MVKAAESTVDKLIDYFENVDPLERDPQTGKPIFKAKDIMAEISKLDETADGLLALEGRLNLLCKNHLVLEEMLKKDLTQETFNYG